MNLHMTIQHIQEVESYPQKFVLSLDPYVVIIIIIIISDTL